MNTIKWGFTNKEAKLEHVFSSVGEGWHPLVTQLINDLFELGWDGCLMQIKEKFGGLRFYIGTGNDKIFDRLYQAEQESYTICEECGKPGKPTDNGWIKTVCEEHTRPPWNE